LPFGLVKKKNFAGESFIGLFFELRGAGGNSVLSGCGVLLARFFAMTARGMSFL
jgi:hypothetical protein